MNHRTERRRWQVATALIVGAMGGAAAALLLERQRRMAPAKARDADLRARDFDMVAEGAPDPDGHLGAEDA